MKIIVACISLALLACTHGQTSSNIHYLQLFGIEDSGHRVRRGVGGGVKGFYIPANSGRGASSSKSQGWGNSANNFNNLSGGGGAKTLPGPISLPVSSSDTSYGAVSSSEGSSSNNFQAWSTGSNSGSNQGSGVSSSSYNHQVSGGGNSGNNFQSWSEQSNQGSIGDNSYQGWIPIAGDASYQAGNSGATDYRSPSFNYGTSSSVSGFDGGASNQDWNSGASSLAEPIGAASYSSPITSYGTPANSGHHSSSGGSFHGNNGGSSGGNYQGWGSGAGNYNGGFGSGSNSLPGPIGHIGGASLQSYSKGHVTKHKAGRGVGGHSIHGSGLQGSGLGGYHAVPVGYQTTEGRHIAPDLLDQVRTILLREEGLSGFGGGAPSTSYGVPSSSYGAPSSAYGVPSVGSGHGGSGRVIGILVEGIDQSIQIAQYHQTSSGSSFFGGSSETLAIPTGSYGVPHH